MTAVWLFLSQVLLNPTDFHSGDLQSQQHISCHISGLCPAAGCSIVVLSQTRSCRRRLFRWATCRTKSFKHSSPHEEEKATLAKAFIYCATVPLAQLSSTFLNTLNPGTPPHPLPSSASSYTPVGIPDSGAGAAGQGPRLLLFLCLCHAGLRKGCQRQRNNKTRRRQSQGWDILFQSNDTKWRSG